jgi:hypothetical protein
MEGASSFRKEDLSRALMAERQPILIRSSVCLRAQQILMKVIRTLTLNPLETVEERPRGRGSMLVHLGGGGGWLWFKNKW